MTVETVIEEGSVEEGVIGGTDTGISAIAVSLTS